MSTATTTKKATVREITALRTSDRSKRAAERHRCCRCCRCCRCR